MGRKLALISMFLFQGLFFVVCACLTWGVIFLDWRILLGLAILSALQYKARRSTHFINFFRTYIKPIEFHRSFKRVFTDPIPDDSTKRLFAFHPHSVFTYGILSNVNCADDFSMSLIALSSRFMLNLPLIGLVLRLWGIEPVEPNNLRRLMASEVNVALLPGGFEQATLTSTSEFRVFINSRKGFIKYCLHYGYTIHPVLVLNEHKAMWTLDRFVGIRLLMNRLKLPGVIFWHPIYQFLFPPTVDMVTLFGKGISKPEHPIGQQPSQELIDFTHEEYILELKRLHSTHQQEYSIPQLKIL